MILIDIETVADDFAFPRSRDHLVIQSGVRPFRGSPWSEVRPFVRPRAAFWLWWLAPSMHC